MSRQIDLIVENATIVTVDSAMTVHHEGWLAVESGRIAGLGPGPAPDGLVAGERIDGQGRIVMPGLVNTHCHATDSLFRGLVEDLPLEPWLQSVWTAERAILTPQTCRLGAELGLAELALSGVTTVMDNFWHPSATVAAAKAVGLRIATGGIFFDPPGMDGADAAARIADAEAFFEAHAGDPMVLPTVMPHGTYTVGPDNLVAASEIARRHGALYSTHAAETRAEQATIARRYGTSVIRHLAALDILAPNLVLAHCVHVDAGEIGLMAESGTHVAHNPMSNLKLASGFAPIAAMLAAGINVTLGTDGAISGNDLDMWLAMRLAATLPKAVSGDATAIRTADVVKMATINGAKALGIADRTGSLEVGKLADFLILSTRKVHARPIFDPMTHIVFSAGRADVTDVFLEGRASVRDGALTRIDIGATLAAVDALQPKIAATLSR